MTSSEAVPPGAGPTGRDWRARSAGALVPLAAAFAAFLLGALLIALLGKNPAQGFGSILRGSFGGREPIGRTLVRAVPLMLVASGICIAFRASVINIGGEGQIVSGGLCATVAALSLPGTIPRPLMLLLGLLAGALGGFLFAALPGILKAFANVNEILSTIMLNIVAVQAMNFLLQDTLRDDSPENAIANIPQTRRLPESSDLPILPGGFRINFGIVVALLSAVIAWAILWRTTLGFRLRAVGHSRDAARYAGMRVSATVVLAMAISGAFCGLAGAVLVFGSESHRMFTDGSSTGFTAAAGFNGIIAALFGGLHPVLAIPSSTLFGGLLVGANQMQRDIQVPAALITAINGLIVVFVVSSGRARDRIARWATGSGRPASKRGTE